MPYPSTVTFIAFLDANPGKYKNNPEPDGYNPTSEINNTLVFRPQVANPEAQGDVETPLTIADLQALISIESLGRLSDTWWDNMRIYLSGGDGESGQSTRADAVATVNNAESRGNITPTEGIDLRDALNSTIPDPNYSATVQGDSDSMIQWQLGGFSATYTNLALGRPV